MGRRRCLHCTAPHPSIQFTLSQAKPTPNGERERDCRRWRERERERQP
uniref:Uncharacterized protein n=1 Tax=Arundo donax TaxID=35708 RepID=A0A0A8XY69_ARUDO